MAYDRGKKSGKHDYMERSERRSGYRPRSSEKKRNTAWDVIRLILSVILCVICFPLGLIALWTCRTGAGTKLLLTVVTAVLFFALAAFALTVETDIPIVTRMQEQTLDKLGKLGLRMEQNLYMSRQVAGAAPAVAQKLLVPVADWAGKTLPGMNGKLDEIQEQETSIIEAAQQAALEAMKNLNGIGSALTPSPEPTPEFAPAEEQPTPEPTANAELEQPSTPEPTENTVPEEQPTPEPTENTVPEEQPTPEPVENTVPEETSTQEPTSNFVPQGPSLPQLPSASLPEQTYVPESPSYSAPVGTTADQDAIVYLKLGEKTFHKTPDCPLANGATAIRYKAALMRGAEECPQCFGAQ